MDGKTRVANLQAYLKLVGLRPLSKRDEQDAEEAEFLVLYASKEKLDQFDTAHPVRNRRTYEAMVCHEIYGRVQVVRLSDSTVIVDKPKEFPCSCDKCKSFHPKFWRPNEPAGG